MTIASERQIKTAAGRAWPGRALAWWIDELRQTCGDIAGWVAAANRNAVTIEAGERYWVIRRQQQPIRQLDWQSDPETCRDALRALGTGAPLVEIPPERLLSKIVQFPAGARKQLDRILEFEIGRHFPFPAERVFFRHRVVERRGDAGDAPLAVEIVAVPREVVAEIGEELRACGIEPRAIALVGSGDGPPLPLPRAAYGGAASRPGTGFRLAASALAASAAAAAVSWPLAQNARLAALDSEIAALKPQADAASRVRAQRQRDAERIGAVLKLKTERPALVATLDRLSRDIPDGSWLMSLSLSGRDLVLDGLSPSAATIAVALERSNAFTGIVFRSPITKDPATGLEHFQLGASLAEPRK